MYTTVNSVMVETYWDIGKQIFQAQGESERAEYGKGLLKFLAEKLTEVMQTQTNGIRNLIMNEYLTQFILLPDLDIQKQIVAHIGFIRDNAKQLENESLQTVENAKKEVEQILLGGEKLF